MAERTVAQSADERQLIVPGDEVERDVERP